ncbi:MAG: ABC transporter ATP-binding protein [Acidimicrobiales bacterium]
MIRRFRSYVRPVRAMLSAGLGASALAAVMEWVAPWPLKFIFDSVIGHKPLPSWLAWLPTSRAGLLSALVGAMLLVAAVLALADYLSTRLVATAGQRVVFSIRCHLFRHIEAQGSGFHQRRQTGDLLARLGGDVQAIQSAMVTAVPTLVRNVLALGGMVTIMLVVDWHYALLALALFPFLFWATRHYLARIKSIQRQARRADGEASSVAQEVLTSMTVVQAFGAEDAEARRYAAATGRGLEENRRAIVAQSEFTPLMTLAMTTSTVLVLFFGVRAVTAGRLTAGDLLVFMAYLRGMYSPVRQLSKLAGVVGRAHAAAERVVEILDTNQEVPQRPGARRLGRARGAIELSGVNFAYPGGRTVLDGVDLEIPAGTRQALVGLTGSGKSTVLRLVPRFLDPTEGVLRLDGTDVADLSLADLRRQVALVPQEPYLFRASVWENILYGSTGRGREAAVAAARSAGLHEVIESFPDGYDTSVAERGSTLSGGQRQCVAVARAMARNAPVLLLDEPTVGLDAELESVVLASLDRVADGRTTITVSHQLSGLRRADQIAVLSNGRITEAGTHAQLLADRHMFWRLDRLQQGDVEPAPVGRQFDHRPRHLAKRES